MNFLSPTDPNVASLLQNENEVEIARFLGQTLLAAAEGFKAGNRSAALARPAPRWTQPQQPQRHQPPQQFAQRGKPNFFGAQQSRGGASFRSPQPGATPKFGQFSRGQPAFGLKRTYDGSNANSLDLFTRRDDEFTPPSRRGRF